MNAEDIKITCSICGKNLPDQAFVRNYPNIVCRECEERAINGNGEHPLHLSMYDDGDNPVYIDSQKCWRRYRYGGFITMLDDFDCDNIGEFYEKKHWLG